MVKLHAIPLKHAPTAKSEETFKVATDVKLAQLDKLLMQLELTATLKDQHADATRL
jgi:hypothetical protein